MKQAVTILQPLIEQSQCDNAQTAGRVLVATVKGDVHDIGKNIATVVMGCNGYEVIDLGVMVPPEVIVATAIEKRVDIVSVMGGDGKFHSVPVEWDEYLPLEANSVFYIAATDVMPNKSAIAKRNGLCIYHSNQ